MDTLVINKEKAIEEVNRWLDFKGVKQSKREKSKDLIEILVDGVCDGILVLNDSHCWVQTLIFPLENEQPVKKLTYKPRIDAKAIAVQNEKIKPGDMDGKLIGIAAALTLQPQGVLRALDTEDLDTLKVIALFFVT